MCSYRCDSRSAAAGNGVVAGQVESEAGAQAQPGGVGVAREHHQLDAVAGGEEHGLVDLLARDELAQQRHRVVDGQPLAQRERRRAVIHADQQDLHVSSSTPITAKKRKPKANTAAGRGLARSLAPAEAERGEHGVDGPGDQRPGLVGAADEETPARGLHPEHARDDAQREQGEARRQRGRVHAIEGLERGQREADAARSPWS